MQIRKGTLLTLFLGFGFFISFSGEAKIWKRAEDCKHLAVEESERLFKSRPGRKLASASPTRRDLESGTKLEERCVRTVTDALLQQREKKLTKQSEQWKREEKVHQLFLEGISKFEKQFFEKCKEEKCMLCAPSLKLRYYRLSQVEDLLENNLSLSGADTYEAAYAVARKHFSPYAKALCDLPKEGWSDQEIPRNCQEDALSEVADEIEAFFKRSFEDREICSVF